MRPCFALVAVGLLLLVPAAAGPSALATEISDAGVRTLSEPSSPEGYLVLQVTPTTAAVTVNGSAVTLTHTGEANLSLAPGGYPVVVTAPGDLAFEGNVTVLSSQSSYLTVTLPPTPSPSGGSGLNLGAFPVPVTATVLGVAAIVVLGVFLLRTPRKTPPASPPPTPEPARDEGPE
jgi:hypothetical protein